MPMANDEIVEGLMKQVSACNYAASTCPAEYVDAVRDFAVLLCEAADAILRMQDRLVRQARLLEHVEFKEPRFPLLEPDDDPGMSL